MWRPPEPESSKFDLFWKDLSERTGCYFRGYALIVVCVLGIGGNILNLLVLTQRELRTFSVNILLTGLAAVDMLFLASQTWTKIEPRCVRTYLEEHWMYPSIVDAGLRLAQENATRIGQTGSIFFVILVTIERYTAVVKSLEARHICTPKRAVLRSILVVLLSLGICLPLFFGKTVNCSVIDFCDIIPTPFGRNPWYKVYRDRIFPLLQFGIPFIAIAIMNLLILIHLRKAQLIRSQMTQRQVAEFSLTKLLLWIVLVFGIAYLPELVILVQLDSWGNYPRPGSWRYFFVLVLEDWTVLSVSINSAANFVLYCTLSRAFRKQLVDGWTNFLRILRFRWLRNAAHRNSVLTSESRTTPL